MSDEVVMPVIVEHTPKPTVDLAKLRLMIRQMPEAELGEWLVEGLPAVRLVLTTIEDAVKARMLENGQTVIDVIRDGGELDGRQIKLETRRGYDVDADRLSHAQELFQAQGHGHVKLAWQETVTKTAKIPAIKKACKLGGEAAKEAEMAVTESWRRQKLVVSGKKKADPAAFAKVREGLDETVSNPWRKE